MAADNCKVIVKGINLATVHRDDVVEYFDAYITGGVIRLDLPHGEVERGPCVLTFSTPSDAELALKQDGCEFCTLSHDRFLLKISSFQPRQKGLQAQQFPPLRSIFVSKLNFSTDASAVRALCQAVGTVETVLRQPHIVSSDLGGCAIVSFGNASEANWAVSELDGARCPPSGATSRKIKVCLLEEAELTAPPLLDPSVPSNTPSSSLGPYGSISEGSLASDSSLTFLARLQSRYGAGEWPSSREVLSNDLAAMPQDHSGFSESLYRLARKHSVLKVLGGEELQWNRKLILSLLGDFSAALAHNPATVAAASDGTGHVTAMRATTVTKACRYGTKCGTRKCKFSHPERGVADPPACRYGAKCGTRKCRFSHPERGVADPSLVTVAGSSDDALWEASSRLLREQPSGILTLTKLVVALTNLNCGYEERIKAVGGAKRCFGSQPQIFRVYLPEGAAGGNEFVELAERTRDMHHVGEIKVVESAHSALVDFATLRAMINEQTTSALNDHLTHSPSSLSAIQPANEVSGIAPSRPLTAVPARTAPPVAPATRPKSLPMFGLVHQVEAVRSTLDIDASLKVPAVVAAANQLLFASDANPTGAQSGSLIEQAGKLMVTLGI